MYFKDWISECFTLCFHLKDKFNLTWRFVMKKQLHVVTLVIENWNEMREDANTKMYESFLFLNGTNNSVYLIISAIATGDWAVVILHEVASWLLATQLLSHMSLITVGKNLCATAGSWGLFLLSLCCLKSIMLVI